METAVSMTREELIDYCEKRIEDCEKNQEREDSQFWQFYYDGQVIAFKEILGRL